jgi:ubiquinone/menaquinone biosynthesis C-methylase UbiE
LSKVAPLNETTHTEHPSVEEHYDKVWTEEEGEAWESWPFFRQNPSALSFALDRLAGNASLADKLVLDLACGVGYSTQELAGRGARVFPLDLSSQGLRKTLQRLERARLGDKVAAVRSSVEQLPFADASIEAVFAQNFLMHVNPELVGREVWRVLKPGGRAIFVEPLAHHPLVKLYRTLFSSYKGIKPKWSSREDLQLLGQPFSYTKTSGFYLLTALASIGFIQKRPWLLKPVFTVLHGLDRLLLKLFPGLEKYTWVSVTELVK